MSADLRGNVESRMRLRDRAGRIARRIAAGVLGTVLVVGGLTQTAQVAQADSGTIQSLSIVTEYDGQVSTPLDPSPNNGVVASNDAVGFKWELTAVDLHDGVLSQTLPVGWTWDEQSLVVLNSTGAFTTSSYELSNDGRTVTSTVTAANGESNQVLATFATLRAIPSGAVANESVYTPKLTGTVAGQTTTASTDPITVVNEAKVELWKGYLNYDASTNGSSHDFGDGLGSVTARWIDFRVSALQARNAFAVGARDTQLAQPFVVNDTYTVSGTGAAAADYQAAVKRTSEAGGTVGLVQTGRSIELTFDGFTDAPEAWVELRFWIRDNQLPANGSNLTINNKVTPVDWKSVEGDPVAVDTSSASVSRTMSRPATRTNETAEKSMYLFSNQASNGDVKTDPPQWGNNVKNIANLTSKEVAPGSLVIARLSLRPAVEDNITKGATDLVVYDFWDTSEQQIVDARMYVGARMGTAGISASKYTVQYTDGVLRNEPESNTWYSSIEEAGGPEVVSGIRVAYTAGVWADNESATANAAYFVVDTPFRIVGQAATTATDHARWSLAERPVLLTSSYVVNVGDYRLSVGALVDHSATTTKSDLVYTLNPTMTAPPGAEYVATAQNLKVVATVPKGIDTVDLTGLDPLWESEMTGDAETGFTITFTYKGIASTDTQLPPIVYGAKTSRFAPTGNEMVTNAVISATGNTQSVSTRSDKVSVIVQQIAEVTQEKRVVGPSAVEVGESITWESNWYNTTSQSQGLSYFVDVLPWNGDPRGSTFAGELKLTAAELTGPSAAGSSLEYTTADPLTVYSAEANDDSHGWISAAGINLAEIDGITALRVVDADFDAGPTGVGGLKLTGTVNGQESGDVLVNATRAWLGLNGAFGFSNRADAKVLSSAITGQVWADGDSLLRARTGIEGATVSLYNDADAKVAETTTDANGNYSFTSLHSGDYRTVVDTETVRVASDEVLRNVYDLDGDLNSDSGAIALGVDTVIPDVDFGYRFDTVAISLTKTGKLVGEATVGAKIEWSFVITNTGETSLEDVELVDHLSGVKDLVVEWPVAGEHTLSAGESVRAHATSTVTAADMKLGKVNNTATATGNGTLQVTATADANATVELAGNETSTPPTTPPSAPPTIDPQGGVGEGGASDTLSTTGAEADGCIRGAVLLLVAGAALALVARRRRSASQA
ncbi:hypothetical protein G7068_02875 [Leucobacter viscericola]|uniref:Uncharacterized protein n=1 Tax=Leucobacter viscericola TaxID=2714935 RepID=A0A6G7XD12_9MICO|nr:SdrD B-like domain-containing protein [Leucobacter viscericola]QIK62261.1 hypothetical protein G7068_02875 [Leucobacter viscericola]